MSSLFLWLSNDPAHSIREHLKRAHTFIQCRRCGNVFDGSDHATQVKKFEEHQRLEDPCQLQATIAKKGISDAQWADLNRIGKQSSKKNNGSSSLLPKSTVQKWNDIWMVLFPDRVVPSNPCKLIQVSWVLL